MIITTVSIITLSLLFSGVFCVLKRAESTHRSDLINQKKEITVKLVNRVNFS